ncbi:hypothetical protein GCM10009853_024130 [Glycomyces scopariae]|uniref:Flp pilus-assembly TadE/G-like n=1 Tax=Glycomyces sambucus TaxID=380244 RepID=A0A1G9J108_9ACTN|nr:hypothetical protein [Glycomyces sambucus]SDL31169.1 hypothetical protein SAMN05216298_3351 [Glycomyces sambucus]
MFSNVSARWRRRLRVAVAVWAVVLLAAAFAGTRATVREQIAAADARAAMDALLGEAAAAVTGAAVLAAGPLEAEACEVTPVRPGLSLSRTIQVSGATTEQIEGLADRFGLAASSDVAAAVWSGDTDGYLSLRITAEQPDPPGGRWSEPVLLQAVTGCRPSSDGVGAFAPEPPLGSTGAWRYGSVPCPGGEALASWTEPVAAEPFLVHETTGGCA